MGAIVVGYDDSDAGNAALDAAADLAKGLGDDLVVVFGYAPPGIWGGEIADHEEAIEEFGEKLMSKARARATERGVTVDVAMVPKRGSEALIEVAEDRDARMIVVGSHGETALKGVILGTTPHRLVHISERPVLVVPATGD